MIVCKKCGTTLTDLTVRCTACRAEVALSEKERGELFEKMSEAKRERIFEEYYALAERLATADFIPALREWGSLLESGELGEARLDEAMKVFRRGALLQDGYSAFRYSRLISRESDADSSFWLLFSAVLGTKEAASATAKLLDEEGCHEEASYYYTLSAKCDNIDSIVTLAKRYSEGIGAPKDDRYAKWYMDKLTLPPIHALKLAYKLRNAEAKEPPEPKSNSRELIMRLVSAARQKGFETAERRLTEILTELGDMSAFVRLGEIYADGIGGVSDPKAAQTALEYAAMHSESAAYKKLGDFYLSGKFGEKNSALALSCYERAAELGEKNAYHLMADMYLGGDSIARDVARAAELYKIAELGGDGEAAKKFSAIDKRRSELYERGAAAAATGAADEAFSLFTLASAMGHTAAPLALARAYLIGMGTKADRRKAYRILREAVDKNTPEAYFPLALCYSRGVGIRMDYKTALSLLSDANARGDERAVTEARKIRKRVEMKFARQAYSRAIRLLFCGKQEAAKSELEYACELGHARSVYTLGTFYEFGFGTPCDKERAYELYEKAYDGGFTDKRNNYKLDMLKTSRGKKR